MSDIQTDVNASRSSYEVEDETSEDEILPPEEIEEGDDEMKNLEAELLELEREEALIRAEEEKLQQIEKFQLGSTPPKSSPTPAFTLNSGKVDPAEMLNLLSTQMKELINNQEFSDIVLVSDGKKVFAHKGILSARSSWFKKQFEINKAARELHMRDTKYPVLIGLLEYIYTGRVTLHKDWAEQLYFVAQAHELPQLQNYCESLFSGNAISRNSSATSIPIVRSGSVDVVVPTFETDKMREMRKNSAMELWATEKSYVRSLQLIFDSFVTPLNASERTGTPIVPKEMKVGMFSYWEVLLKCHVSLLKSIEDRVKIWEQKPEMGDIFIEKTAFIKLYKHYVNNFDKSVVEYKQLKESNPKFKDFLAKLEYTPKLNMQSLQSYLIMPIQRIPRYVLMLQDMLKSTVETHPDYENLKYGLKTMKELADYINANKNDADEINKILAIQDKLIGWPTGSSLVKPRRRIIKEGTLFKPGTTQKYSVWLFTDALLYTKPKGKDKLSYKGLLLLPTSSINISQKADKFHFEIISQSGRIQFNAAPEEKDIWIKALQEAIEKSQKELLNSAFSGFELKESEGSKQFMKLREEENQRRRSEVAAQLKENEFEYVRKLKLLIEKFLQPLKAALHSNYPILPLSDINEIFHNFDQILESHIKFSQELEDRVDKWDPSNTTLGDLFLNQVINSAKLYQQYHEHFPNSADRYDQCMLNSVSFKTFVVQTEADTKIVLNDFLELPLKRMPYYYLHLEELLQYTPDTHVDYSQLKSVATRLKELVEIQQKGLKSFTRKASSKSMMLQRKGSWSLGSQNSSKMTVKGNSSPVQIRKSIEIPEHK